MKTDTAHYSFFDACCMIGRHVRAGEGDPHTADDLLEDMDRLGIAESLVVDCLSRECHPMPGNRRVVERAAGRPRLHPAWAALPHAGDDEQPPPAELLRQMHEHRVGALMLYPAQYCFSLDDWCVDAFLEPFAEARVPVFINGNEAQSSAWDAIDFSAVVALCKRLPDLPVIVSGRRFRRSQRMAYRALDACANLHIELSGWWLHRGIETITRRWGARRLIFGSHWPYYGQHMTLAMLTTAEIDDEDKRRIAGGNLRRLIAWCEPRHADYAPPPPADEFVAYGRSGRRPRDMTFADCHGHLGGRHDHYHIPQGADPGRVVADMDRLGVEKSCVFCFTGISSDETVGNDLVAEAVKRYPGRFVGFTMVNPHRGPAGMRRELERGHAMGLRGVKLIAFYQGYPEDGPNIEEACRWAHEHGEIVLNHNWGSPDRLELFLKAYPNACFVTGHATAAYADVMTRHRNLFVCSCPLTGPRACEELVARIGADRLLFGSDLLDLPIAWGLGPILFSRLSPDQKRLILGENLRAILKTHGRSARNA